MKRKQLKNKPRKKEERNQGKIFQTRNYQIQLKSFRICFWIQYEGELTNQNYQQLQSFHI